MSDKFHLNPATGVVARCRADVQTCRFSGSDGEFHYETIAEAREGYENLMQERQHVTITSRDARVKFLTTPTPKRDKYLKVDAEHIAARKNWEEQDYELKRRARWSGYSTSDKWLKRVNSRRDVFYKMQELDARRRKLLPKVVARDEMTEIERSEQKVIASSEKRFQDRKDTGDWVSHPEITESNRNRPTAILAKFTGKSDEDIRDETDKLVLNGATLDEAYQQVWKSSTLRTDKPIVSIDLEVASPLINGRVDTGPYSYIIEVGYTKRNLDGTTEEHSFLSGVPHAMEKVYGTGAEHIHNISPDMVKGLKPLYKDSEKLAELSELFEGSLLIAHNAAYETSQFKNTVPGFAKQVKEGRTEILDTKDLCRFFVREAESNRNQDFVKSAGLEYEGAHRALADAKMTLSALLKHDEMK